MNYTLLTKLQAGLLLFLLFAAPSIPFAQQLAGENERWQAADVVNRPLLVAVVDDQVYRQWEQLLKVHQAQADYNLLLLRDTSDLGWFCQRINATLNEEPVNKRRVYWLGVLGKEQRAKYQIIDMQILAGEHWQIPQEQVSLQEWRDIWARLQKNMLWTYDVETIQRKATIVERSERIEGGIGLSLMTASTAYRSSAEGLPNGIRFWSYNAYRKLHPRWLLNFSVDIGVKLPNPQRIIQEQVFSQVDIFALLNGDEVEITLDTEIKGHMTGGLGVGLSYLLPSKGRLMPYVGTDLRFFGGNFFFGRIDTTLIIDSSGGFPGGGNPDELGLRDGNEDFSNTSFFYLTLSPHIGMYHQLGERWLLDLNAAYQPDPAAFRQDEDYLSLFRWRMGLRYRLIGKRNTRYEYLRIAATP